MQDESVSSERSKYYWAEWFLGLRGNEFFCEIDEDFIVDRFNLTGLNTEVAHYAYAYDLITDSLEDDLDQQLSNEVEKSARHLYGLIHARYIITTRGLTKMMEKFNFGEFGKCPRVLCSNQSTLPVGLSDVAGKKPVKLYCPKCEDVYNPPSRRHHSIDGVYFGTSFPHLLLQVHPNLVPIKLPYQYTPKIFGFKIYSLAREQDTQRLIKDDIDMLLGGKLEEVDM